MSVADEWPALRGGLPDHQAEVMAAHEGAPPAAEQDRAHGAGLPAADRGMDDQAKYAP